MPSHTLQQVSLCMFHNSDSTSHTITTRARYVREILFS